MIETDVNATIRIEGAKRGLILWRNNSGAFENKAGRWVRYGLANDSARVNDLLKSSDLVGVLDAWWWGYPALRGIWTAVEAKPTGWHYTGRGREPAQLNYINLVRAYGGIALFATSWETVSDHIAQALADRAATGYVSPRADFRGGVDVCQTEWLSGDNMPSRGRGSTMQLQNGGAAMVKP